jgi:hypothetical protein
VKVNREWGEFGDAGGKSEQARAAGGWACGARRKAAAQSRGCSAQAERQHAGLLLGRSFSLFFFLQNFSFSYFFLSLLIFIFPSLLFPWDVAKG